MFSRWYVFAAATALVLIGLGLGVAGNLFALSLATRIAALAIAATSLQLIMGYGGLISLGQAAFVGIGAYVVGICASEVSDGATTWLTNGFVQLAIVVLVAGSFALVTGVVGLRTRGVYFLMITLAFSQMLYLGAVAAYPYGGEDGLTIYDLPRFPGIDLSDPFQRYIVVAGVLLLTTYAMDRLIRSPFGLALRASASSEARVSAVGYDPIRLRLIAYVISGILAGVAGMLLAIHTEFVSPALMHWTRSGDLAIIVVLGGRRTPGGPILGAAALIVIEEVLSAFTSSWPIILGILLLLLAVFAREGLGGLIKRSHNHG